MALCYDEFFNGMMKREKKKKRSSISIVFTKMDKLLRNMYRLQFCTVLCVLCTHIHFLFLYFRTL